MRHNRKGYRACRTCDTLKKVDEGFTVVTSKMRQTVCDECYAEAERERERQAEQWRQYGRDCPRCGEHRRCPEEITESTRRDVACIRCQRKTATENKRRRLRKNPEPFREANRKWRQRYPEKEAASKRSWREKRRELFDANPDLYAEYLEDQRIAHRLRLERRYGIRLSVVDGVVATSGPEVPVEPLIQAIERLRKRLGVVIDKSQQESDFESFCEGLGLSDRTVRDWRAGARTMVRMATVDRVLTNTEWNWWDVWGPEDPGYEKVRQAFEGDEEIAA